MKNLNRFIKGIRLFRDKTLYQNDEWTFPSSGIRLTDWNEKGLAITFIRGNVEIENGQLAGAKFKISPHFIPIGWNEYNGILYIVSLNEFTGEGEIGSYPSPKGSPGNTSGFQRVYSPFKNFDKGSGRENLRTELFNFSLFNRVDVQIKRVYDESVNLYLSDYLNPNIVINSGFNQSGYTVGNVITEQDFEGSLNLFPTTNKFIRASLKHISDGGVLRPGMYFVYFRYVKKDLTRTPFIGHTSPIQVFSGNSWDDIEGNYETTIDGDPINTTKKIVLEFENNFDSAYDYIELAVIRYSEDQDQKLLTDSYLISNLYEIGQIISDPNNSIVIDGREEQSTLIPEQIFINPQKYTICKTQTIVDSRYYGGNWRSLKPSNELLSEFASLIKCSYAVTGQIQDNIVMDPHNIMDGREYQHKINEIGDNVTFKYTGFFRGETYPFAIKALLTDGSITEAYPVQGSFDRFFGDEEVNNKGLYTFPFFSDTSSNGVESHYQSLGIKFITTDAMAFYNENIEKFKDIKAIIFLRGDRIENLITQGIGFKAVKGLAWQKSNPGSGDSNFEVTYQDNRVAAWLRPFDKDQWSNTMPHVTVGGTFADSWQKSHPYMARYNILDENKFGVYSPSYLFEDFGIGNGSSVYVLAFKKFTSSDPYNNGGLKKVVTDKNRVVEIISIEYGHKDLTNQTEAIIASPIEINAKIYLTKDSTLKAPEGFQTAANLGVTSDLDYFFNQDVNNDSAPSVPFTEDRKEVASLGYATPRYLGFITDDSIPDNLDEYLVNVYNSKPDIDLYRSFVNSYNPSVNKYYEISDKIEINTIGNVYNFYKGDCFLQRTYFRAMHAWDFGTQFAEYDDNTTSVMYANYGVVVSVLTENTVNTAMRNDVEVSTEDLNALYSYYPKINSKSVTINTWAPDWRNDNSKYEAFKVNKGYNKILADNVVFGYDPNIPDSDGIKYTRIFFSPKSTPGEKVDSFKQIGLVSFRDFAIENGPIYSIQELMGTLVSIQEKAISQHFLGEEKLETNQSSNIVLQKSGIHLSDQVKPLSSSGTQHQFSIVNTSDAIFGVDFEKKEIWMVGIIPTKGASAFGYKNLTRDLEIKGWIEKLINNYSNDSDIISKLPDFPSLGYGIISGFDKKYNEVHFTFHMPIINNNEDYVFDKYDKVKAYNKYSLVEDQPGCYFTALQNLDPSVDIPPCNLSDENWLAITKINPFTLKDSSVINPGDQVIVYGDNNQGKLYISPVKNPVTEFDLQLPWINYATFTYEENRDNTKTITFDKNLMSFIGEQPFKPMFYTKLLDSFMTVKLTDKANMNLFWNHNNPECPVGIFYEEKFPGIISFIVVGQDAREVVKMFNSYMIESNQNEFMTIEFQTDYQDSIIDPFVPTDPNMFYLAPEYIENMWQGPISANDVENDLYDVESEMRGTWLKVTIKYNGDNEQFIRKFLTDFIISFS